MITIIIINKVDTAYNSYKYYTCNPVKRLLTQFLSVLSNIAGQ